ncbi:MAG: glycerate kinase [Bacteroidales bacterium]|nr:glycerate kinase [Bacteroidales bacterium]MCF8390088.1 glycerate kinase [Bacteroidales bacterium]
MEFSQQRHKATEIFLAGIEGAKPEKLINDIFSVNQNKLLVRDLVFDLSILKNIYLIGFGKASADMAQAMEVILGDRITAGHIITKYGHSAKLKFIEITEAGHPVPDENGLIASGRMVSILSKAEKDDLVICLISGGGSALLADVPEGCTLEDVKKVNSLLLNAGADIREMNCIRKHLSGLKGGLLSQAAFPARVLSLILSDVVGDSLDVIASGPTSPDPTTFADALAVIEKYKIKKECPVQIYRFLQKGLKNSRMETLKEGNEIFLNTHNVLIGNNLSALHAAKEKAELLGYKTLIITNKTEGDVGDVAESILKTIRENKSNTKTCLLFGGEPTVKISGKGLGGRGQHLALLMGKMLKGQPGITFLSGGTDGSDGHTDAAGAVVDSSTLKNAKNHNLDIEEYINSFDSYQFFKQEGGLIITGPTKTNVMDLMIVLIE